MTSEFTFIDWFAGIGGFRLGLERAGMRCVGSCEIDKKAREKYEKRFGEQPTWADIRDIDPDICAELHPPPSVPGADLWCGGFPCQDLSIAGKGAGLAGARSGLWWEWMRHVERHSPRWLIIENVPGLLSSNSGRDFGCVMASLAEVGYDAIWRVLDAQFFGVPQQRRRVYIIGHLGAPCPPEILFEPEGSGWNPPPRGKTGKDIARPLAFSTTTDHGDESQQTYVTNAISAKWAKGSGGPAGDECQNLVTTGTVRPNMRNNSNPSTEAKSLVLTKGNGCASKGDRIYGTDGLARSLAATSGGLGAGTGLYLSPTIRCTDPKQGGPGDTVPIICHENISGQLTPGANARALRKGASHNYQFVCTPPDPDRMRTPSGIPGRMDLYVPGTALGGCKCADGPRYRALGNAVAVPVIHWIGNRIMRYIEEEGKTTGQST